MLLPLLFGFSCNCPPVVPPGPSSASPTPAVRIRTFLASFCDAGRGTEVRYLLPVHAPGRHSAARCWLATGSAGSDRVKVASLTSSFGLSAPWGCSAFSSFGSTSAGRCVRSDAFRGSQRLLLWLRRRPLSRCCPLTPFSDGDESRWNRFLSHLGIAHHLLPGTVFCMAVACSVTAGLDAFGTPSCRFTSECLDLSSHLALIRLHSILFCLRVFFSSLTCDRQRYMWMQLFGQKYTPFLASLFHSAARRHGRRCARAGRGKSDIDVVVQLEWVNPTTTKQHLILQNSSVVSKKNTSKNAQDADATPG